MAGHGSDGYGERGGGPPAYSEVMEDYAVFGPALAAGGGRAVVISSAGDNVFHAALDGARHVFGVDVSPAQTDLCRLKEAAVQRLEWPELLELLGVVPASPERRVELLARLADCPGAGRFAEPGTREVVLAHGLAACGKLAAFVAPLREGLTELVGAEALEQILDEGDRGAREALWDDRFERPEVIGFLAAALNRETISDSFIPAAAFDRMAEPEFHRFYHGVLRHRLVELDPRANFFLHRLWLGRFPSLDALPPYLLQENHRRLRERLGVISWHTCDAGELLATLPEASVDSVNLSNVLDWCDDDHHDALWSELDRVAAPGARLFLRSFLADRPPPAAVRGRWSTDPEESARMAAADRVGYYSRYELWVRDASGGAGAPEPAS